MLWTHNASNPGQTIWLYWLPRDLWTDNAKEKEYFEKNNLAIIQKYISSCRLIAVYCGEPGSVSLAGGVCHRPQHQSNRLADKKIPFHSLPHSYLNIRWGNAFVRFPADMALSNREKGKEIVADDIVNAKSIRNYLTIKQPTTAAEKGIK